MERRIPSRTFVGNWFHGAFSVVLFQNFTQSSQLVNFWRAHGEAFVCSLRHSFQTWFLCSSSSDNFSVQLLYLSSKIKKCCNS